MHGIYKVKWTLIHSAQFLMYVNLHIQEYKKIDKLNHWLMFIYKLKRIFLYC
jgi:hypothetical protein